MSEQSEPGHAVAIMIPWRAFTTAAPGLVACKTPAGDLTRGYAEWELAHAPTGRVVAHFDGPEQAQAAAAKLADIDWVNLDPFDAAARAAVRQQVIDAVDAVGGTRPTGSNAPMWSAS